MRGLRDALDVVRELWCGELRYRREHPEEHLRTLMDRVRRRTERGHHRLAGVASRRADRWRDRFGLRED